jgi:ZIP family zinc transporter
LLVFFPQALKSVSQATILAVSLALSAGVMLYVSFIEIFYKSLDEIASTPCMSEGAATLITTICFFAGMLVCVLLEMLVNAIHKYSGGSHEHTCPAHMDVVALESATDSHSHGHEHGGADERSMGHGGCNDEECQEKDAHSHSHDHPTPADTGTKTTSTSDVHLADSNAPDDLLARGTEREKLGRMGLLTALAIAIHNFPEGLATFLVTLNDAKVGASLGTAIAIHNIPEGICVAIPIYYATGNKWKAFFWSVLSGVTEPIGGLLGFAVLQPVFTPLAFGVVFSMVGGMMIFIVMHELLPAAHRYMGSGAKATAWLVAGMVLMAISLVLFGDFETPTIAPSSNETPPVPMLECP